MISQDNADYISYLTLGSVADVRQKLARLAALENEFGDLAAFLPELRKIAARRK